MRFIERISVVRRAAGRKTAEPKIATANGEDLRTTKTVRPGLTSSRNPDRHGPRLQEAIGVMSWGALSFAATLFVRMDNPREMFVAWGLAIFFITWIVTALASRTARLLPVRRRIQNTGQRR